MKKAKVTIENYIIVWNPNSSEIALLPLNYDPTEHYTYDCSWGGCNSEVQLATPKERIFLVYQRAINLIMDYGMDALAVHNTLVKLQEYRSGALFKEMKKKKTRLGFR